MNKLKEIIKFNVVTAQELADHLSVSRSLVYKWTGDVSPINLNHMQELCKYVNAKLAVDQNLNNTKKEQLKLQVTDLAPNLKPILDLNNYL